MLEVTVDQATGACSTDQLYAGLTLGCEGGIHGMSALWSKLSEGEDTGFLLIDADNGFNAFSRIQMLWVIRHEWPAGAWFAFNCYKHHSLLLVRDPGGSSSFIFYSREGCIQGDPFAMVMYAMGTLPLIRKLKSLQPDLVQSWYADDASAMGKFNHLHTLFQALELYGPEYGYIPNASK